MLQEEPGPSVQRDNLPLGSPGLKPPHRARSHRAAPTRHGRKANRGFINSTLRCQKVIFSKLKLKKRIENTQERYRERSSGARLAKNVER
jgi:hypothetical protein